MILDKVALYHMEADRNHYDKRILLMVSGDLTLFLNHHRLKIKP